MDLVVAATAQEMQPLLDMNNRYADCLYLVTGVGLVETILSLSQYLSTPAFSQISRVLHIGVAGAYLDSGVNLLDICLAEREILADFGVVSDDHLEPFTFPGTPNLVLDFAAELVGYCEQRLRKKNIPSKKGVFLTVNSASGTLKRGNYLRDRYRAICENMEGFAVARVCQAFALPLLELRCVSNLVEDRNINNWRLPEACQLLGRAVAAVID